ncbi:MAG: hypothetical protein DYG99_09400 [Bacteroidetes bacterium CHB5]|nr:hypothetical protein [Bacteroidetes bacterium CHB5]
MLKIIFKHLKYQWYKYVIEIVVVILGILIAYNLERWNDGRNNRKREIEMLKEFKAALAADLAEIQVNIREHENSILSSRMILRVIKDNLPYHDSLDACFAYTHAFTTFSARVGPIEQLKSTNLEIISNDSLRLNIITMYDVEFPSIRTVEFVITRDYEQLRDFDRLYFEAYDIERISTNKSVPSPFWGLMRPVRFTELKENPEYAALLRARISNQMGLLRGTYIPIANSLSNLLYQIEQELIRLTS